MKLVGARDGLHRPIPAFYHSHNLRHLPRERVEFALEKAVSWVSESSQWFRCIRLRSDMTSRSRGATHEMDAGSLREDFLKWVGWL